MDPERRDAAVRKAAFDWLEAQSARHGNVLPRELLVQGFEWQGQRVSLVAPNGIFKPKVLPQLPLSITTVANGPYEDNFADEHRLLYRYRGTDPHHPDNERLRAAMRRRVPLVHFFGLIPGRYRAIWPVFVAGDNPNGLAFTIMADTRDSITDALKKGAAAEIRDQPDDARRRYITSTLRRRLHQQTFRERVLHAYHEQCALCRLRHRELLDASHIVPDTEAAGEPRVNNGLALCKIHHAAFDASFLAVRPNDYRIELRQDILHEDNGPMLRHGLQGMHGRRIFLPHKASQRPARDALEYRYERFLAYG